MVKIGVHLRKLSQVALFGLPCNSLSYNAVADNTYESIFIRLAVVASQICEIPRNMLKSRTYSKISKQFKVWGHPRSSIVVSIESIMQLHISH